MYFSTFYTNGKFACEIDHISGGGFCVDVRPVFDVGPAYRVILDDGFGLLDFFEVDLDGYKRPDEHDPVVVHTAREAIKYALSDESRLASIKPVDKRKAIKARLEAILEQYRTDAKNAMQPGRPIQGVIEALVVAGLDAQEETVSIILELLDEK